MKVGKKNLLLCSNDILEEQVMFVSGFGTLGFTTRMVKCPLLIVTGVLIQPIIFQCTQAQ